jgi:hypothetical protein
MSCQAGRRLRAVGAVAVGTTEGETVLNWAYPAAAAVDRNSSAGNRSIR